MTRVPNFKAGGMAVLAVILMLPGAPAFAQTSSRPVADYGAMVNPAGAAERPDPELRYRVVFNVTKASDEPGDVNPSLERVARFLNLLGRDGVRIQSGDVVAVVHGPATASVLRDAAYAKRAKDASVTTNPNLSLIAALKQAGVVVSVCSQALHGQKIESGDVAPSVRLDVAALTTMANLQLRGYALIPE
jgi:intracellular sulfur oxidation DsrE/DsrF family protein